MIAQLSKINDDILTEGSYSELNKWKDHILLFVNQDILLNATYKINQLNQYMLVVSS